jgi:hypothetical protein
MILMRCTRRLMKSMSLPGGEPMPPSGDVLGNWYADIASTTARTVIIALNVETMLTVVLPVQDTKTLGHALWWRLLRLLNRHGASPEFLAAAASSFDTFLYRPTESRSMRNHLAEVRRFVEWWSPSMDPAESHPFDQMENTLAEWLYGPPPYRRPVQLLRDLMDRSSADTSADSQTTC